MVHVFAAVTPFVGCVIMATEEPASNTSNITFGVPGLSVTIAPKSIYEWIAVVAITIILGFFAVMFVDSDQLRKHLLPGSIQAWPKL